jgi:hypothetical protein
MARRRTLPKGRPKPAGAAFRGRRVGLRLRAGRDRRRVRKTEQRHEGRRLHPRKVDAARVGLDLGLLAYCRSAVRRRGNK